MIWWRRVVALALAVGATVCAIGSEEVVDAPVLGHRVQGLSTVPEEEVLSRIKVPVGKPACRPQIEASLEAFIRSVYFTSAQVISEERDGGVWYVWTVEERLLLPEPVIVQAVKVEGVGSLPAGWARTVSESSPPGLVDNYSLLRALAPLHDA
jgi:outer membrane protein assembly factor BamA